MKKLISAVFVVLIGLSVAGGTALADNPHKPKPADTVYQCFNNSGAIEATRGALNHKPTCAHAWDYIDSWAGTRT